MSIYENMPNPLQPNAPERHEIKANRETKMVNITTGEHSTWGEQVDAYRTAKTVELADKALGEVQIAEAPDIEAADHATAQEHHAAEVAGSKVLAASAELELVGAGASSER